MNAKPAEPIEKPESLPKEDIKALRSEVKKSEERLDKLNDIATVWPRSWPIRNFMKPPHR